jgi:hypothetical protein
MAQLKGEQKMIARERVRLRARLRVYRCRACAGAFVCGALAQLELHYTECAALQAEINAECEAIVYDGAAAREAAHEAARGAARRDRPGKAAASAAGEAGVPCSAPLGRLPTLLRAAAEVAREDNWRAVSALVASQRPGALGSSTGAAGWAARSTQLLACTVPRLVWADRRAAAARGDAPRDDGVAPRMWPALVVSVHEVAHDVELTIRFLGQRERGSAVVVRACSVAPFTCVGSACRLGEARVRLDLARPAGPSLGSARLLVELTPTAATLPFCFSRFLLNAALQINEPLPTASARVTTAERRGPRRYQARQTSSQVSLFCTVTFRANPSHNLTRSPSHIFFDKTQRAASRAPWRMLASCAYCSARGARSRRVTSRLNATTKSRRGSCTGICKLDVLWSEQAV